MALLDGVACSSAVRSVFGVDPPHVLGAVGKGHPVADGSSRRLHHLHGMRDAFGLVLLLASPAGACMRGTEAVALPDRRPHLATLPTVCRQCAPGRTRGGSRRSDTTTPDGYDVSRVALHFPSTPDSVMNSPFSNVLCFFNLPSHTQSSEVGLPPWMISMSFLVITAP